MILKNKGAGYMGKENDNKKKIKIKPFNYKWYQFLIIFGIINIYFFYAINSEISNIYETFSKMLINNLVVDGSDFSLFANFFSMPIIGAIAVISIGVIVLFELIFILLFKFVYFKSVVKDEEKILLCKYVKKSLLYFTLANVISTVFWGDIQRIKLFIFSYLPLLLFTFIFIYLKMKNYRYGRKETEDDLIG
jgi:hypothetical protein